MSESKFHPRGSEEYVVKFWLKLPTDEFVKQCSESVWFNSKSKHAQAEKQIVNKYRGIGGKVTIISVTYQ